MIHYTKSEFQAKYNQRSENGLDINRSTTASERKFKNELKSWNIVSFYLLHFTENTLKWFHWKNWAYFSLAAECLQAFRDFLLICSRKNLTAVQLCQGQLFCCIVRSTTTLRKKRKMHSQTQQLWMGDVSFGRMFRKYVMICVEGLTLLQHHRSKHNRQPL